MKLTETKLRSVIREEILNELGEVGERKLGDILINSTIVDVAIAKEMGSFSLIIERDGRDMEFIIEANGDGTLSVKN